MNKLAIFLISFIFLLNTGWRSPLPAEGMYPMSEISNIDLVDAGLKIDPSEIFNPDGVSLTDALVNISGCTGSFISEDGLILTNHHCAFRSINNASTTDNNYLENGFYAEKREDEIPAEGYKCRITESYEDVTDQILSAVEGIDDPAERIKIIDKKRDELAEANSDESRSIEASVSEMFVGQSYVLFRYRIIKDIRLVFAPPRSIGEFGGESDNWIWPRHTGDFAFMRAYVAPDGSAAEYSESNIPYKPKKHLKVNINGVSNGDFVFILGYPGRTYRHNPSQFIEFQQLYQLPYISTLYEWMLKKFEEIGKNDEEFLLKSQSRMKSLANVMKNYRGKLQGLSRLNILEKKRGEEKILQKMILENDSLNPEYSGLFSDIEKTYKKRFEFGKADLWLSQIFRQSTLVKLADFIWENAEQAELPDSLKKKAFKEGNIEETLKENVSLIGDLNIILEEAFLTRMIEDADLMNDSSRIRYIDSLFTSILVDKTIKQFTEEKLLKSGIQDEDYFRNLCKKTTQELKDLDNPLLSMVYALRSQDNKITEISDEFYGEMGRLQPKLIELKKLWQKKSFIPDANRTLRLTFGYIKGYSPADAVYYSPVTTLTGVIEKSRKGGDYEIPEKLRELYYKQDYGNYYSADIDGLPVAILYNTDTTGGNSGSPILDANGNLIGVNFDRAYEATINDFAWDDSYSRSIGVDIRYILWVTEKIGSAENLVNEITGI